MKQLVLVFKNAIYLVKGSNVVYTVRVPPALHSRLKPLGVAGNV